MVTRTLTLLIALAACQHSSAQPDATAPLPDVAPDTAPEVTSLPLGEVGKITAVACQNGTGTCMTIEVTCPGIEPLGATLQIIEPAHPTRTVAVLGPGGGTKLYQAANLVDRYLAAGFRIALVAWDRDWELASTAPNVKAAACRAATVFRWIYDQVHVGGTTAAYCVHGSSGGAGAVGYALAHYGEGDFIDHALMSFGPVFSEIAYGCDPMLYGGGPRDLCPALPDAPFAYNRNNNAPALNAWEGTSSCVVGTPAADEIEKWTADSIDTGGMYSYPRTGTAFYYCVPANAGAGLGTFFIEQVTAASKAVTCFTDCSGEALTQGDMAMMVDDMAADCTPRHQQ